MPQLLVLTYDPEKPSYRYRIDPLAEELRRRGWTVSVDVLPSRRYGTRIWQRTSAIGRADVVLLHKLRLHPLEMRWVARCNAKTVFEFDDATWLSQADRVMEAPKLSRSRERAFDGMCRHSGLVIAGNAFLALKARQQSPRVAIVPTAVDSTAYPARSAGQDANVVAVWIGLPGNLQYLEPLRPVFAELTQRFPGFKLRIVCSKFPSWDDVPIERVTWRPGVEFEVLPTADIGLMPLKDDDFTRGKCAFKLLQYMAAGLPCVASPVGANTEVVVDGETGRLASSNEEWLDALSSLGSAPELRHRFGAAGRARVVARYSLDALAAAAADLIQSLCETPAVAAAAPTGRD